MLIHLQNIIYIYIYIQDDLVAAQGENDDLSAKLDALEDKKEQVRLDYEAKQAEQKEVMEMLGL